MKKQLCLICALLWGNFNALAMDLHNHRETDPYLSILQDNRTLGPEKIEAAKKILEQGDGTQIGKMGEFFLRNMSKFGSWLGSFRAREERGAQKQEIESVLVSVAQHPSSLFKLRFEICDKMLPFHEKTEQTEKAVEALLASLQEPTASGADRLQASILLNRTHYGDAAAPLQMAIVQDEALSMEWRLRCAEQYLVHQTKAKEKMLSLLSTMVQELTLRGDHQHKIWKILWDHSSNAEEEALAGHQLLRFDRANEWLIFHDWLIGKRYHKTAPLLIMAKNLDLDISSRLRSLSLVVQHGSAEQKAEAMSLWWAMARDPYVSEEIREKALDLTIDNNKSLDPEELHGVLLSMAREEALSLELRYKCAFHLFLKSPTNQKKELLRLAALGQPQITPFETITPGELMKLICLSLEHPQFILLDPPSRGRVDVPLALQTLLITHAENLLSSVPPEKTSAIIQTLSAQSEDQWPGAIQEILRQYHHQEQDADEYVFEIHDYGKDIQETVMGWLEEKLEGTRLLPLAQALEAVDQWIQDHVPPEDHAQARAKIKSGMETEKAKEYLVSAYTFVTTFHLEKMAAYLEGFVGESLDAYADRADPGSCIKGVEERVITGLRSLDEKLDLVFAPAETLQTAKAFLANANFGANPNWMVQKLKELGATDGPSAAIAFTEFGRKHIGALNLGAAEEEYIQQIKALAETLEESYATTILPAIRKEFP